MTTTELKTAAAVKTTTKVKAPKAAKNTPVAKVKKDTKPAAAVKPQTAPKQKVFALIAGLVMKLEHKGLRAAVAYHTKAGNLEAKADGVALTAKGVTKFMAERVLKNPAAFQEAANFIKNGGPTPKSWAGQPITVVAKDVRFPNMLYWGSFATTEMRLAFAALWAK